MSSLSIENLSGNFNLDPAGGAGGFASDLKVQKEMRQNGLQLPPEPAGGPAAGGASFAGLLQKSLETVNQHQAQADTAIKELVAGRTKNIHETMLAIERADTSLKLMMQVRNKILDAYREIMRMQV